MMKRVMCFALVCVSAVVYSQDPKALRHCTTPDRSADFYILLEDRKIRYNDTLLYHWYKSQQVHVTQGYSSGDLLDGLYTQYYVSGQLAESGMFKSGLRNGEWKSWYEAGQLASVYHYKEGIPVGAFFEYDETGQVVGSGYFRNGKLHGEALEDGEIIKYRRGKRKEVKEKDRDRSGKEEKENDSVPEEAEELQKDRFWSKFFREKEKKQGSEKEKKRRENDKDHREEKNRKNNNG